MSQCHDADAFMRHYLRRPNDVTNRLVFADWLEETGTPPNTAWALFIRAKAEDEVRPVLSGRSLWPGEEPIGYAADIRATLTIPVALFLGYPKSLLQLLPGQNIVVRLEGHDVPRAVVEFMPESVARENRLVPLQLQKWAMVVAMTEPDNQETIQKLQFILNRDIVAVRATEMGVQAALDRCYGQAETESVDSVLYEDPDTMGGTWSSPPSDEAPVDQLVQTVIREAIGMGGKRIQFAPRPDRISLLYRLRGIWMTRDDLPRRLLAPLRERFAALVGPGVDLGRMSGGGEFRFDYYGTVYTLRVAIESRTAGPVIDLDIADEIELR